MQRIVVERSIWIRAPREQVWEAVMEGVTEQISKWRAEREEYQEYLHRIEVVDPPRQFVFCEHYLMLGDVVIRVQFRLEEEDGGTRLIVSDSGYEALPNAIRQAWVDGRFMGYEGLLKNLKAHVNKVAIHQ